MSAAEIRKSAEARMAKSLDTLKANLGKIRTCLLYTSDAADE